MASEVLLIERLYDLLKSGEWVDREIIFKSLAPAIPPGQALRQRDYDRGIQDKRYWKNGRERVRSRVERSTTLEGRIATGQRTIVRMMLIRNNKSGTLQRRILDGRVEFRLIRVPRALITKWNKESGIYFLKDEEVAQLDLG